MSFVPSVKIRSVEENRCTIYPLGSHLCSEIDALCHLVYILARRILFFFFERSLNFDMSKLTS
jgi:ABC-type Na+ transport system ATPase subunit NatA